MSGRNAVLLLSGGLDSTTLLALATSEGFSVNALSFQYGQRHTRELEAARALANRYSVARHEVVQIDLAVFGKSALVSSEIAVPKRQSLEDADSVSPDASASGISHKSAIPVTYVPARNTIFLSYALAFAEVTDSKDIFIGVNSLDYSGYPDCRPEFIRAFQAMADLATRSSTESEEQDRIKIRTPLQHLTKKDIVELGVSLGVDYSGTISCYDPVQESTRTLACGQCDACLLRLRGFEEAGLRDPTQYAIEV